MSIKDIREAMYKGVDECLEILKLVNDKSPIQIFESELIQACERIQELK